MPCNDPFAGGPIDNGLSYEDKRRLSNLEASLCAILTELEKSNNLQIVKDAEKNGKVSIINEFYEQHKVEDNTRIDKLLNTLSQHEINMLKEKLRKHY